MSLHGKVTDGFPSPAVLLGGACAVLSLMLAVLMWQGAGNPAVLLVWLASAAALVSYARFNRRRIAAFERIASQRPSVPLWANGSHWDGLAEDVAFTDIPLRQAHCGAERLY